MKRREFVSTSIGALATLPVVTTSAVSNAAEFNPQDITSVRAQFPRLETEVFLNAAGGTPLGSFAEKGIDQYLTLIREGPQGGTRPYFNSVLDEVRQKFASLIGAEENEIGFVECTKRGEQLAINGVADKLDAGGNIVSNDLHFSGSLHNLEGLRRKGTEVRITASENFSVSADQLAEDIDDNTALVTLSLTSNINGHIEQIREITEIAHNHGALVFADIIQTAGGMPLNVKSMGIDMAACSSYKWLFGIHGAGFLYVAADHQGSAIEDVMFPGQATRNYPPFRINNDSSQSRFAFRAADDASRYEPGHVSYLGYCAVYEGLKFIEAIGIETIQAHSVRLNQYLLSQLDQSRYQVMSTHVDESPILTIASNDYTALRDKLRQSDVNVGIGGDTWNQIRISPAIYNNEHDMDRLAEVLMS